MKSHVTHLPAVEMILRDRGDSPNTRQVTFDRGTENVVDIRPFEPPTGDSLRHAVAVEHYAVPGRRFGIGPRTVTDVWGVQGKKETFNTVRSPKQVPDYAKVARCVMDLTRRDPTVRQAQRAGKNVVALAVVLEPNPTQAAETPS